MPEERRDSFNDAPVSRPEDDAFGIAPFAQALASTILQMQQPVGVTIGLNGPWGSGKTSAVNLIRHYLEPDEAAERVTVLEFRPWWFRGEEALTLAFLQELGAVLREGLGDKSKALFGKLGRKLLQAGPIVGPAVNLATAGLWGAFAGGATEMATRLLEEGDSLGRIMEKLRAALAGQKRRYLVVIDDIDRLTPSEALQVFKLMKSVGHLPNVIYLAVFDRQLAEAAVSERYPSEGPHFLEKIIQATFELPHPLSDDLYNAALKHVEVICGSPDEEQMQRFWNVFYSTVAPLLSLPRHVTRLANALSVSWGAVSGEVNIADFLALETLRLSEPKLHAAIRRSKAELVGVSSGYAGNSKEEVDALLANLTTLASEGFRPLASEALRRLFPRLEGIGYADGPPDEWDAERRVCVERHFDTYFRFVLGDDVLRAAEVSEMIAHAADDLYVRTKLKAAAAGTRRSGQSYIPVWLDELNVHVNSVAAGDVQPLLTTLFSIADEIDLERDYDRSMGFGVGTHLRLHWLVRKLTKASSLPQRSAMYVSAAQGAPIGWLVDFFASAYGDHYPREGKQPEREENCLVLKDALPELQRRFIASLSSAAASGELIRHQHLGYLLFRWLDFGGDEGQAVREWLAGAMTRDNDLALLAKAFTSASYVQGMGMVGLGDRVQRKVPRAAVEGLDKLLDLAQLRARVEALAMNASDLTEDERADVVAFRNAWVRQERNDS